MRLTLSLILVVLYYVTSCKTTSPRVARADVKSAADNSPDDLSGDVEADDQSRKPEIRPASGASLCEAIKSEEFPGDHVESQIQWLCDRGGFAALKAKAFDGRSAATITEFFAEHDKTLYYASGFSLVGSFAKISAIGGMFCGNFEDLRAKFGGLGFESVKSIKVSTIDDDSCEYLQETLPEWGVRADMKAQTNFGVIDGQVAVSKVDAMIAPLNYSSLKQFSSLLLIWETSSKKVEGVYLIKSQVNVPGSLMGATRSRLKSTISGALEGYAKLIRN